MHRFVPTTVLTAVLLLGAAGPAAAHAGLMPGLLPPGQSTDAELVLVHGCGPDGTIPATDDDEFATTAVTMQVPDELTVETVEAPAGWDLDAGVDELRWVAEDPAGVLGTVRFPVQVTGAAEADGLDVWIPVVQDCTDGEQLAWLSESVEHEGSALPAMRVTVAVPQPVAAAAGGLSDSVIVTLAVAAGVAAGGGAIAITARRSR